VKYVSYVLIAIGVLLLPSVAKRASDVVEFYNPYSDFRVAQASPLEKSKSERWITLAENEDVVSFTDVSSIIEFKPSKLRSKILYILAEPIKIDGMDAKIALRDVISDCKNFSSMTVSTSYYGETSEDFKSVIPGSPQEIKMPIDSVGYEEIEKTCKIFGIINKSKRRFLS
jgi:hypothetical protein